MMRSLLIPLSIMCVMFIEATDAGDRAVETNEAAKRMLKVSRDVADSNEHTQVSPTRYNNASRTSSPKKCSRCGGSVPSSSKLGETCPHCGAYWGDDTTISEEERRRLKEIRVKEFWDAVFRELGTFVKYFKLLFIPGIIVAIGLKIPWFGQVAMGCKRLVLWAIQCVISPFHSNESDISTVRYYTERIKQRREEEFIQKKRQEDLYDLYMDMMCCVMYADMEVHPSEVRMIRHVLKVVEFPWDDENVKTRLKAFVQRVRTEGIENVVIQTLNKIREIDVKGNSKQLLGPLNMIIKADGIIDPNEENILKQFTKALREADPLFDDTPT